MESFGVVAAVMRRVVVTAGIPSLHMVTIGAPVLVVVADATRIVQRRLLLGVVVEASAGGIHCRSCIVRPAVLVGQKHGRRAAVRKHPVDQLLLLLRSHDSI